MSENEDKPSRRFGRLVACQQELKPRLPYVHTTDVFALRSALSTGTLEPQPCDVFSGEMIIYLFYGRPSYKMNNEEEATTLLHYMPVCFILKNSTISNIKRIFPFDSGAFSNTRFSRAFHKRMEIEDFALSPAPDTPGKLVGLFFKDADSYLRARPLPETDIDPQELEAVAYHALISDRLSNSADDRVSGIEAQISDHVDLFSQVEAVVLPQTFLDSASIRSSLQTHKIVPLAYRQTDRTKPSDYNSRIYELCYEFYERQKILAK